jgi:hypothetical protein
MFGTVGKLGATEPGAGVSSLQALLMEVLLTAGFDTADLKGAKALLEELAE